MTNEQHEREQDKAFEEHMLPELNGSTEINKFWAQRAWNLALAWQAARANSGWLPTCNCRNVKNQVCDKCQYSSYKEPQIDENAFRSAACEFDDNLTLGVDLGGFAPTAYTKGQREALRLFLKKYDFTKWLNENCKDVVPTPPKTGE